MANKNFGIGKSIQKVRLLKDLTQEELARKADNPYATLIKIIGDTVNNAIVRTMQQLAMICEVSVDELLIEIKGK